MLMNLTLTVFIFKICKITCSQSSVEILFLRVVEAGHVLLQGSMVNVTHTSYLNRRSYQMNIQLRGSHPEVFCKKGVLRNFTKVTGKQLCQSLFFNKVASLIPERKETLKQMFSCEFCEISKNTFFQLLYLESDFLSVAYLTAANLARLGITVHCQVSVRFSYRTPLVAASGNKFQVVLLLIISFYYCQVAIQQVFGYLQHFN